MTIMKRRQGNYKTETDRYRQIGDIYRRQGNYKSETDDDNHEETTR